MIDGYGYTRLLKRLWRGQVHRGGLVRLLVRLVVSRATPRTALGSWWPEAFARYLTGFASGDLASLAAAAAQDIAADLRPEMRAALAAERSRGAELWLVSATVDLLAEAVADELHFDRCLCTVLQRTGGRFTGRLAGPICRGAEKLRRVQTEATGLGIAPDFQISSYYADGFEDLPLLEAVGRPHAVHPDERLAHVARQRGYILIGAPRRHRAGG